MRKLFLPAILLLAVNCAVSQEQLDFTVEGTIRSATCEVTVSPSGLIKLPISSQKSLARVGDRSGKTRFTIVLNKCPDNSNIYFDKSQATVNKDGRLLNSAPSLTSASNVELEMLDASGNIINLAGDGDPKTLPSGLEVHISGNEGLQGTTSMASALLALDGQSPTGTDPTSSGSELKKINFYIQYYATGASTAGKVTSSATFVVEPL